MINAYIISLLDFKQVYQSISFSPGGIQSRSGAHPWQASVRVRGRDKTFHWCGAVVISRFHVLTAAHCLREFPVATYVVRVGDYALGESWFKLNKFHRVLLYGRMQYFCFFFHLSQSK